MEIRNDEHLETDLRLEGIIARQRAEEDAANRIFTDEELGQAIFSELTRAERHGKEFASLHEAYAVMLEEVDEVWDITRMKRRDRSALDLQKEFIQIAAMAVKSIKSMRNFIGGNV
jgi:hypothetical protein